MEKKKYKYRLKYFIRDDIHSTRKLIQGSWTNISSFDDSMAWISKRLDCGALIEELTIEFK